MSDPTLAAFRALREKLAEPERWCQENSAVTSAGIDVDYDDPRATAWCLSGAICLVSEGIAGDPHYAVEEQLNGYLNLALGADGDEFSFIDFNDEPGRTHAEILDLIDAAERRYRDEVTS